MEFCYLWIEDYRGFIHQGFNFSDEFFFEYESHTSRLTRSKREQYIKGFFGENILSVTGIIGKNSSGKTNLLELVQYVMDGGNTIINKPFFVVCRDKNGFLVFCHKVKPNLMGFESRIEDYQGKIPDVSPVFFSNVFDGRRHNFSKRTINISTNDLLVTQFGETVSKNYQSGIQQQIRFVNSNVFKFLENIETELNGDNEDSIRPTRVLITSPLLSAISARIRKLDEEMVSRTIPLQFSSFVKSFRKKITSNLGVHSFKYMTAFLVFIDFLLNRDIFEFPSGKVNDESKQYYHSLIDLLNPMQAEMRIDEIFEYITGDFAKKVDSQFDVFEMQKFLLELHDYNLDIGGVDFREDIGAYTNRKIQFSLNYDRSMGSFLVRYLEATTNQNLTYSIEWGGMSSGHKAYINLFSNFYSVRSKIRDKVAIITIDEGDLYFHPKWQSEFLFKLINILPKLLGCKCQIMLTTHSPFLVSDLPKENLIFLGRKDDNSFVVIPNGTIEGETFGGNIGELYLDAFFMQGSLISHFAASKIQELVNRLTESGSVVTPDDRRLVNKIGEDMIRIELKRVINGKN